MIDAWGIMTKFVSGPSAAVELSNAFVNMEFDVVTSEQHKWGADITTNPVEDGGVITDHIKLNPDSLDISGVISNASLSRWKGHFIEKLFGLLDSESNVQRAFDQLRKLLENRQPVMIYTRYRNYPDMVLTSLSIPRSKESGDAIEFNASFTHIKRVTTLTVDASEAGINPDRTSSKATGHRAARTKNKGNISTLPANIEVTEKTEQSYSLTTSETQTVTNIQIENGQGTSSY